MSFEKNKTHKIDLQLFASDSDSNTPKYTQAQVDDMMVKARENINSKYEKTHIAISEYEKINQELNDLKAHNSKVAFRETFKANGGNIDAFDDFISNNKEILTLEQDKQVEMLNNLKETKKFYFNNQNVPYDISKTIPNENDIFKQIINDSDKDGQRFEGTIYKNKW